ncbi:Gp15 family bacteriophage protein [Streptococcus agalactiae]|uniref:Gp15 family bacteriophage protein n=1 Tax=Streptococcus agalactiae TaxID=1311 RepID=UPI001374FB4B|nr:Gp15 family bacteriophage protein [Streptococcus agalactiae]KAF1125788.1 hypothetical protein B8U92_09185 [Streptococcus agalactiae]MCD0021681.1 hypothetical protein [Streptococcus agalactiae]
MFDISKKIDDKLILNEKEYQLFLSFDNVLKVFDMWSDDEVNTLIKPRLALCMLTQSSDFKDMKTDAAMDLYEQVFEEHIKIVKPSDQIDRYDIEGNILPKKPKNTVDDDDEPVMSIKYDGEFIFSSFMQAYQIDLIEQQGKLHWQKFNALLSGLPDGTKMIEVMKIRSWKPSKGESQKEKSKMRELQEEYALPRN